MAGIGIFYSKKVVTNPFDCLLRGIWSFPGSSTPSGSTQKAFFRKLFSFAYGHAPLQAGPSLKMYTVHFLNGRSPSGSTFLPAGRHGARHSFECKEERRRRNSTFNFRHWLQSHPTTEMATNPLLGNRPNDSKNHSFYLQKCAV